MSKKDYQAIARAIHAARIDAISTLGPDTDYTRGLGVAAENIADALAADNPRFDRARFIEACETGTTRGMRKVSQ